MQTSYDDQQIAHTESLWDLELDYRLALTYPNWIVHVGADNKVFDITNPNGNDAGLGLFIKHAPKQLFNTCMGNGRRCSNQGNSSHNLTSTKRDWLKESFIRELNYRGGLESGNYNIDSNLINNKGLKKPKQRQTYV